MATQPHWHIERTDAGHHISIVAGNGEKVLVSEVLNRAEDAEHVRDVVDGMYGGPSGADVVFTDRRTVTG